MFFGASWIFTSVVLYFKQYKGKLTRAVWGMQIAHFGVAIYLFGVSMTEHTDFEVDSLMNPGETKIVQDYEVKFIGVEQKQIENYRANIGHFVITQNGKTVAEMSPQKAHLPQTRQPHDRSSH